MIPRLRTFLARVARVIARGGRDQGFLEEVTCHIDRLAERYLEQGLSPDDARAAALRQFGNQTALLEQRSDMRTFPPLEHLAQDVRYGARLLRRNPGFAVAALLTLGLGIGANTAIFSLVEGLLLRPLPYQNPERLVVPATIFPRLQSDRGSVAYADVLDWKAQTALFEAVAAYRTTDFTIVGGDEPERVFGLAADEDYFRVMGRPMRYGRPLKLEDNYAGADPVAVLGHDLWRRRFGANPGVVGTRLEINGTHVLVVGVAQPDSTWPDDADIFLPLAVAGRRDADTMRRDNHVYLAVARLRAGVSVEDAQRQLTVMGAVIGRESANRAGTNWKLHPLIGYVVEPFVRQTVLILMAAALLVLVVACVNVANLLIARGATRVHEVAIRTALGAGRMRLATQFITESALLGAGGGVLGLLAGYWGLGVLLRLAPPDIPRLADVRVDGTVLAFTGTLCFVAVLIAGVIPALHGARRGPATMLGETTRTASSGRARARVRTTLVVAELTVAVILLAGAGLLIRSFDRIRHIDPGFPTRNLLTFQVALPRARYAEPPQLAAGFAQLGDSIRRVPGIVSVSATSSLPVDGGGFYLGRVFLEDGQPEPPASSDTRGAWSVVLPGYFRTMGIPVLEGREFTEHDTAQSPPVIMISRAMARQMFPGSSPLGRRIRSWRDENKYREIVGVVGDIRYDGLTADIRNNVYVPHSQDSWTRLQFVVRAAGDPYALLPAIRSAVWSMDRRLAVSMVQTMEKVVGERMAQPRFSMFLLCVFAATAVLLAGIGIYGVIAFTVTQRTREIGIRVALGAARPDVLRLVAGGVLRMAAAGVGAGVAGALLVTRLMRSLLYNTSPTDVATLALVSAVLTVVALFAAWIPARRAWSVDPVETLRHE